MTYDSKRKQLKEILPLLWNSYEHMLTIRKTNTQNSINFLLVVVSFLSAISVSLYTHFNNPVFLLPAILQIITLMILLKSFFIASNWTQWFQLENTLKNLDDKKFEVTTVAALKAVENSTMSELTEMQKIISKSLFLILFSLYSALLAGLLLFAKNEILYISILALSLSFVLLYRYYRKLPKFDYAEEIKRYVQLVEEWLRK